jgi:hypothetical protein
LKGILSLVRVAQHAAADPQDHWPMSLYKGRERQFGSLAAAGRVPLEKLTIRQLSNRPGLEQCAKLPHDSHLLADRHLRESPGNVAVVSL